MVFALSTLLMGQAAPKTKKQLMDEALQEKLDKYTAIQIEKCNKKIFNRAQAIVDSILLKEAQEKTIDTFERPPKPLKPNRPALKVPKDTTAVGPLFRN
jgi:hypothetical protein